MDRSLIAILLSLLVHLAVWWWLQLNPPPAAPPSGPTEVTYVDPPAKDQRSKAKYIDAHPAKPEKEPDDLHDAASLISNLNRRYKKQLLAKNLGPEINSKSHGPPTPERDQTPAADPSADRPTDQAKGELALPQFGSPNHRPAMGASSTQMQVPWVEFGDLSVLNSDRSLYYVFYARMQEQVGNRWSGLVRELVSRSPAKRLQEMARADRRTVVEIVLDADGDFQRAHVEGGSGFEDLDYTGVEAFRMATPFVHPPKGMVGSDGLIHVHVVFEVIMRPPLMGGR